MMTNEIKFLKECIGIYLGKAVPENFSRLFLLSNPTSINDIAAEHRLLGLMHYLHINGVFNGLPIPEKMLKQWKITAWQNSFENQLKDANAKSILKEIEDHNIEYVYLKGKAVRQFHKTDYICSSTDLDIFIDKSSYPKLKQLLLGYGYSIPEPGKMMKDTVLNLSEFEDSMNEIMFVKKEKTTSYIIDVQWDFISFGTKSPLHRLYEINNFIMADIVRMKTGDEFDPYTLPLERQLYIMAFHHGLHHGFRGMKWFVDMANFYITCSPDLYLLSKLLTKDSMKIVGIAVTLIHEYAGLKKPDRSMRRTLCTNRLVLFELAFYRSMLFNFNEGIWSNISLRIVKFLLPYRHRNKFRVLFYLLFNPDSIIHRVDSKNSPKGIGNLSSIIRIIAENLKRYRRPSDE
ncbi:MAG: nucleotidyltransferase family protein [Clostridia bacterium]|nr:nucleotidyltransferase family protein [Clostridia bacterium]MBN2882181.1 nucleotidyltransferase family protein [Clostridia bacterium]